MVSLFLGLLLGSVEKTALGGPPALNPSDDPADYNVDTGIPYSPIVSEPRWVVPGQGLPVEAVIQASNNNVAITFHQGRLYLAWRTSPTHFASSATRMYLVSSEDLGVTWQFEREIALGTDVREPSFLSLGQKLIFNYFEAGKSATSFTPSHLWRTTRVAQGVWTAAERGGEDGAVPWEIKVRGGRAWRTLYRGSHYDFLKESAIDVRLQSSDNGVDWHDVDAANPVVYHGGVSEVGWEFDADGSLWGVTRNEDGDDSGFGSHVVHAAAASLGRWEVPRLSDPERYDSPRMFRHGNEIYLIARRDIGGPFDFYRGVGHFLTRRALNLTYYSLRPKRTALYRIDKTARRVVWLQDLPSTGDTAFPSVHRLDAHRFLVANYTSPLTNPNLSWIKGQTSSRGTAIYFVTITFKSAAQELNLDSVTHGGACSSPIDQAVFSGGVH